MTDGSTSPPRGQITIKRYSAVRIVSFRGEHDLATADLVRELLDETREDAETIVVDLTAVTFIDSTIVGVLVNAYQADTPPKIRIVVARHTQPRDMLTMTGLTTVLPLYDRLEEAVGGPRASDEDGPP